MGTHNLLRLGHILGGVLWVGAMTIMAFFVIPAIRAVGPGGGAVMRDLVANRKLPVYLAALSWLTIMTGGVLAYRDAGSMGFRWFEQGSGLIFGIGAVFGFVGGMIGLLVNAPAAKKLGALGARAQAEGRAPTAEELAGMTVLQDRLFGATRLAAALLILASAAMASARYWG